MSQIKKIFAREIIDSRGIPTVEAALILDDEQIVEVSVPSSFEDNNDFVDLRDKDTNRFNGMGVTRAVSYINDLIGPKLINASVTKQVEFDSWLSVIDPSPNANKIGVNTVLTLSLLFAKAGAKSLNIPFYRYVNYLYTSRYKEVLAIDTIPTPIFNMINGGKYNTASIDFQEFFFLPSSSFSFPYAYQKGIELFHELRKVLLYRNATVAVGEEGGYSPNLSSNIDALEILTETANQKNLRLGVDIFFAIDVAANFINKSSIYQIHDKQRHLKKDEFFEFIRHILQNYSVLYLEDPFTESDRDLWIKLENEFSTHVYIASDELTRANKRRIDSMMKESMCNTFVIKPTQIGTISKTIELIHYIRQNKMNYVFACGTSETNDDSIADIAVGLQSIFVKFGAPVRGERVAKYNRLWKIETELKKKAS